ncbi:hypothetical protein [Paenibacillus pseudetheri]|uniref:Uncharacterized protein n=1 Tax=Paenibacillus pseudetheri TaxID=2897682 RepID=A0ABN8FGS6_9BACL|nr:hypothetical protein [Paenibacillus pseudetheri]CAH1057238.1 hypothetical protein PAECIP111894_03396 [Paenibacillus pseudetheri]
MFINDRKKLCFMYSCIFILLFSNISFVNGESEKNDYSYDISGRLHQISIDDEKNIFFSYDENGNTLFSENLKSLNFTYGYTLKDTKPTETGLTHLGYQGTAWVDDENRGTGFDMGRTAAVNRIELRDTDASTHIPKELFDLCEFR